MTSARIRSNGISLHIGPSRDAAGPHIGERAGAAGTPNPMSAGSTPAAGATIPGSRLDRPLAPGETLSADGDRLSPRRA
jgi:hypothetical protein